MAYPILILIQMMSFVLVNASVLDSFEIADGVAKKRAVAEMVSGLGLAGIAFLYTAPQLQLFVQH